MPAISFLSVGAANQVCEFNGPRVTLGRSADNDICISDDSVSSHHALIEHDQGDYYLIDLNSTNGVSVNNCWYGLATRPPGGSHRIRLQHDDRVRLGNVEMLYHGTISGGSDQAKPPLLKSSQPSAAIVGSAPVVPSAMPLVIKEMRLLLSAFARNWHNKDQGIYRVACEASRQLRWIDKRLVADNFVAAFVGLSKVGKSTLLNAVFGEEVTPRRATPMTQVPIEFQYGAAYTVSVSYHSNYQRMTKNCANGEDLRHLIEQYASEEGEHATGDVKHVSARLPAEILSTGLIIADTPGFGAAQIGDKEGSHNKALVDYLPKAHQVFWIVFGPQSITEQEKAFYDQYLRDSCNDLIVTNCDDINIDDRKQLHRLCEEKLGLNLMSFYFLSGKKALAAKLQRDHEALAVSGVHPLEERLRLMGTPGQRYPRLVQDLVFLCRDLGAWKKESGAAKTPWPSVEWKRLLFVARDVRAEIDGEVLPVDRILERYLV